MKCTVCNRARIDWQSKLTLLLGINVRCRNCGARYKQGSFIKKDNVFLKLLCWIVDFILSIIWFPLLIFTVWVICTLSWVSLLLGLVFIIAFVVYSPIEIDESDPANKIIQRVHSK